MSKAPPRLAPPVADHLQRDLGAWAVLAALVLLMGLAGPFFAGEVYTSDDLGGFHLPVRAFYAEQLARGEPFDWSGQLFAGFYLSGEGQAGTYHPVHWLLYRLLPLHAALGWEYLLSYPFMLAGTYLLLHRRLGRRDAAAFGALAFTFSGFNLLHFVHPNAIAVVAHIPWLLWSIDVSMTATKRLQVAAATAGIALLTGSQLLLGYPQYVWFSVLAEGAFALSLAGSVWWGTAGRGLETGNGGRGLRKQGEAALRSPWFRLFAAKTAGLMIGAVQLLPSMAALAVSARGQTGASFTNWGSLHPANLVQLIAPYLLSFRVAGENTHEESLYLGAVPLVLIVWVWICRAELGRLRRPAMAVAGFGLLSLVLAMGQFGGLYRLQRFLPLVGSFRFPCRYVVLVQLAAAVLSAIGLVVLIARLQLGRKATKSELQPLVKLVAVSAVVALAGLALQGRPTIGPVAGILAGPVLIGTAAWLVAQAARGSRRALVGVVLFAAVDLGIYGLSYAVYRNTYRLEQYVAATLTPPAGSDGRVLVDLYGVDQEGLRSGNQMLLAGWKRADGYAGLEPARRLDYRETAALRVAGVRWVHRNDATAAIGGLEDYDDHWLEVPRPLPRARLVAKAQASENPASDIAEIEVDTTALVDGPLRLGGGEAGHTQIVCDRPGRMEIRTGGDSRQLLVVSESYHGGWRATVDGRPEEVLRVNGDFMGCVVGPGRHDVVLEFRPRSLRDGAIVSCLGLGAVLFGFAGAAAWPAGRFGKGRKWFG